MRRTIGASAARSGPSQPGHLDRGGGRMLTLAREAVAIDAGATYHDVVADAEAAFAGDIVAIAMKNLAISEDRSLVEVDTFFMDMHRSLDFGWVEEVPRRPVDHLIGGVAQDVDNAIRGVEHVGLFREIYGRNV
jgi:hypothetical protein